MKIGNNTNRTALVTGANSGIGFETAYQLAESGYKKVILLCRTTEKGENARKQLIERGAKDVFDVVAGLPKWNGFYPHIHRLARCVSNPAVDPTAARVVGCRHQRSPVAVAGRQRSKMMTGDFHVDGRVIEIGRRRCCQPGPLGD